MTTEAPNLAPSYALDKEASINSKAGDVEVNLLSVKILAFELTHL